MSTTSHYLTVDGINLHYLEAGDGPPVLLLHGWPTNSHLWRHSLDALAPHRRAIALDLPGFGKSDKPADASYSFPFYDRVISGFLDQLGIDKLGLAVHDLGGPVGMHWAVNNRERILDLALLNTLVFPRPSWAVVAFVAATYIPGLSHWLSGPGGIRLSMKIGTKRAKWDSDALEPYLSPYRTREAQRVLAKTGHGLHPGGMLTISRALADFDVPVRLIYGKHDRILPDVAQTMSRIQRLIPHAERTELPDCGHFLQEDRPYEVATLLAEFFASTH